ncbi:Protein of unknown function [Gryllus bimaculatus]|nr:Protein of unknown function [Gryllus bimaculatus]
MALIVINYWTDGFNSCFSVKYIKVRKGKKRVKWDNDELTYQKLNVKALFDAYQITQTISVKAPCLHRHEISLYKIVTITNYVIANFLTNIFCIKLLKVFYGQSITCKDLIKQHSENYHNGIIMTPMDSRTFFKTNY